MKRFFTSLLIVAAVGQAILFSWFCLRAHSQGLTLRDIAFLGSGSGASGGGPPAPAIDCSFDQAIYSPNMNQIFAVRGEYLYQLDADANLLTQIRFCTNIWGDSSICELGDSLYVSTWRGIIESTVYPDQHSRDIYRINRTNLTSTALGVWNYAHFNTFSAARYNGFQNLTTDGTNLFGIANMARLFRMDPGNVPAISFTSITLSYGVTESFFDLSIDPSHNALWVTAQNQPELDVYELDNFFTAYNTSSIPGPVGIAFCPANTNVYCVTGTTNLVKADATTAYTGFPNNFGFTTIPLTNASLASMAPARIKYRASDGKLYIPTWENDQVVIFDPVTDTVTSIKSGFAAPFDVVFTGSKAFAVQQSSLGLKEITP